MEFWPFFPACGCRGRGFPAFGGDNFPKTFKNSGDLCFIKNFFLKCAVWYAAC
ncbi:hypothetical protein SRB521_00655 [Intestinimonas butyriciproducens]|nr:hypothetical protein SRB521_00655 [Intestinimonas butyriciproducens]